MIIANILGGLGNQMFQYAAAKALANALEEPLSLDVRDFSDYTLHRFELLKVFTCSAPLAEDTDLRHMLGWRSSRYALRALRRPSLRLLRGRHLVVEPHFHFWPEFFDAQPGSYLLGYWQSEKYFAAIADRLRQEFTFKQPLRGRNAELAESMAGCEAVSLHIRRGDYVTDAKTNSRHGVCSLDYYRQAIARISAHVAAPVFFVFSDDIPWTKENLKLEFPCVFIDHNQGENNYCDMQLMSLCRHHIIANSSFSWWGAWLNPRQDKVVIAPQHWFAHETSTADLVPTGWLRV